MHQMNVALRDSAWVSVAPKAHMAPNPRCGTFQRNGRNRGLPGTNKVLGLPVTRDRVSRTQGDFSTIMSSGWNRKPWCYERPKTAIWTSPTYMQ